MRRLALVLTLVGCNQVLGLHDVHPIDAAVDGIDAAPGPCDPLPFDHNRYLAISQAGGMSWQAARDLCGSHGFDLAVLDQGDGPELAMESTAGMTPFWFGVSFGTDWTAIDGCTPELDWGVGEPVSAKPGDCVLRAQSGMRSMPCTTAVVVSGDLSALCETPRPSVACRAQEAQRNYSVLPGQFTHAEAAQQCAMNNGHLVEIDSSAELADVLGQVAATVPKFWVGATLSNGHWQSPTGCPTIFTWGPTDPAGGDCVMMNNGAMETQLCADPNTFAAVLCERNT